MISYDSNLLIYFLESHPEFGPASRRVILDSSRDGVVLSTLVIQEVLTGFVLRDQENETVVRQLFDSLENTEFIDVNKEVADKAVCLTARYGRKILGYDAIHIASAIVAGAYVFYTNDERLASVKISEIEIRLLTA